jgi:hypothetical protein
MSDATNPSAVTEEELARARKWFIEEASKKYVTSLASEDLHEWAAYFALYARQEREAEREKIATMIRSDAFVDCDEECSHCKGAMELADRIERGEP